MSGKFKKMVSSSGKGLYAEGRLKWAEIKMELRCLIPASQELIYPHLNYYCLLRVALMIQSLSKRLHLSGIHHLLEPSHEGQNFYHMPFWLAFILTHNSTLNLELPKYLWTPECKKMLHNIFTYTYFYLSITFFFKKSTSHQLSLRKAARNKRLK